MPSGLYYNDNTSKTAVLCNVCKCVRTFADKATTMNTPFPYETMELINQGMYSGRTTGRLFDVQHNQWLQMFFRQWWKITEMSEQRFRRWQYKPGKPFTHS